MSGRDSDFWTVSTYYNLTDGERRVGNFRAFRDALSTPLLTIEWNPDGRFQLQQDDSDILLQVSGGDLMWQKERLIELAIEALPDHVKYVAWVDCDVLFANPRWAEQARSKLGQSVVVQLFDEVANPGAEDSARLVRTNEFFTDPSDLQRMQLREGFLSIHGRLRDGIIAYDLDRRFKPDPANCYNIMTRPAYGFAWAARVDFLREAGAYTRCIMGGGDLLFSYGVCGLSEALIDNHRSAGWSFYGDCDSYRRWAARAADACCGRLDFVSGRIFHLFHGTLQERQYKSRIDGLVPYALDLDRDISARPGEPWRWQRDRNSLNQYFIKYLRGRNEDRRTGD